MQVRCKGCFCEYDSQFEVCPYCGYVEGNPPPEVYQLYAGTVLANRYVIGNVLGFGGFGITYKAWDQKLETAVAIKEYYPSGLVNRSAHSATLILFQGKRKMEFEFGLTRFLSEAKNMSKFNTHKNIVNIYDYFEENRTAYIVMEFLDGCTLGQYMHAHSDKLEVDESLHIIESVCSALKDIHKISIIHRDISPDNIFMCRDGRIKLIDFGAARFSAAEDKQYTVILKPGFAPPEQYEQVSVQGPWTDIYALGATLYYMLTGEKPEESTNRRIKDELKEPSELNPEIPKHISLSVMKAMALDRHMRFTSIADFEKAIKREKKVVSLKKEHARRRAKRFVGVLAGMLVLSFVVSIFSFQMKEEALQPAEIELWYPEVMGVDLEESYTQIIKDFTMAYQGVQVKAIGIPEEEYTEKLETALRNGKAPDVFRSTGLNAELLKKTCDLEDVVFPQSGTWFYKLTNIFYKKTLDDVYFLSDYEDYFPERKQVPSSFNVPVVYVNTSLVSIETDSVSALSDLLSTQHEDAETTIVINDRLKETVAEMFGAEALQAAAVQYGRIDDFTSGNVAFYISDTADFYDVRAMGTYSVLAIDLDEVQCSFYDLWSVSTSKENQEKASKRFVEFILSYNAQNKLYGAGNKIKAIPINKDALDAFCKTFQKIGFVFKNQDQFVF